MEVQELELMRMEDLSGKDQVMIMDVREHLDDLVWGLESILMVSR